MGQNTRSQGISFTHEMWERIGARCKALRFGRSQYFQMLVEWDLRFTPEIHAHKGDGKWHLYPQHAELVGSGAEMKAAEEPASGTQQRPRQRARRR